MNSIVRYFSIFFVICLFYTCQKEKVAQRPYPRIKTANVTNISASGATFNAEVISGNPADIIESGFIWDQWEFSESPSIVDPVPGQRNNFKISGTIRAGLEKGKTYYVAAYVKTPDYLVYGKSVSFTSLGSESPVLKDFNPKTGTWGDTIKITGKNFGIKKDGIHITLGNLTLNVISLSDSTVTCKIPEAANNVISTAVNITVAGQTAISAQPFSYVIPEIQGVLPEYVTYRDTVFIRGNNLVSTRYPTKVSFNDTEMAISFASANLIKIVVPDSYKNKTTTVKVFSPAGFISHGTELKLKELSFSGFIPEILTKVSEVITLQGDNFHPVLNNNQVMIDGFKATLVEGNTKTLKVQLPEEIIPEHDISVKKSVEIKISIGEFIVKSTRNLEVDWRSKWTRKKDFPGAIRSYPVSFSIDQKGYVGLGYNQFDKIYYRDFWQYDPTADTWSRKSDYPGSKGVYQTGISFNGSGYAGLGNLDDTIRMNLNDFYKYSPGVDSWTKLADYAGRGRGLAVSYFLNGNLHLGGGQRFPTLSEGPPYWATPLWDNWSYDPSLDQWTSENDLPDITGRDAVLNIEGSIYKIGVWKIWQLQGSTWIDKGNGQFYGENNGIVSFTIGSKGYLYRDVSRMYYDALVEYDPSTGSFVSFVIPKSILRSHPTMFSIGQKAYLVGGYKISDYSDSRSVWEFDPSLPVEN